MLATLAVHDKRAADAQFVDALDRVEQAADDERNHVRKAVNRALRGIGKRSPALHAQAVACATRLAPRSSRSCRWIAAHVLRELDSDAVQTRLGLGGPPVPD